MKYDDASWHYGGDFPSDLPQSAGATHIAMFVAWALLNGLAGELHANEFACDLAKLKDRTVTPATWFLDACDGKFTDEDLSEEGNRFAQAYYGDAKTLHSTKGYYLQDYTDAVSSGATLYHVPDTWATFDRLQPVIRARFNTWKNPGWWRLFLRKLRGIATP